MTLHSHSIRVRLTLWYAAALGVLLLMFATGIYILVKVSLARQLQHQLDEHFTATERALHDDVQGLKELDELGAIGLVHVSADERLIYRSAGWQEALLNSTTRAAQFPPVWSWTGSDGDAYRLHSGVVQHADESIRVIVAVSEQTVRQTLHTLATILLLSIPLAVIIALVGGYFLADRVLAPIKAITVKAHGITAERLSERLPVHVLDDEFGQLAIVFNDLLARLDGSFQRLRRFASDASHELRTPLTAIRSVGEVALQDDLDTSAYRDVIGSMLEETDRLTRFLDDLLTLTRADADRAVLEKGALRPAAIVRDTVEILHILVEDKRQTLDLELDETVIVEADRRVLRQAVLNLLDNAIKYSASGGEIRIVLRTRPEGKAVLEVIDRGPGIAGEHREKVFERFYRVDKSRSLERGTGLGLAIARWAVEINGGTIELESEEGKGSTFRIVLPIAQMGDGSTI